MNKEFNLGSRHDILRALSMDRVLISKNHVIRY